MNVAPNMLGGWVWREALPLGLVLVLAMVSAALAVMLYARSLRRRPGWAGVLLAVRLIALAALCVLLAGPSVRPAATAADAKPPLAVLVDTSASMLTPDVGGEKRIDYIAKHWLQGPSIEGLRARYDVRVFGFDRDVRPAAAETVAADGRLSRYAESIERFLRDPQHDAFRTVLVIGDGHDTDGRPPAAAAALAQSQQRRVHTVAVGSSALRRDAAVVAFGAAPYFIQGETGRIVAHVHQVGLDDAEARIRLTGPGVDETRRVPFEGRSMVSADFDLQALDAGRHVYRVSVAPVSEESDTQNNEAPVFVRAIDARLRVLLLEGMPFWDTRDAARALRGDRRIELTTVTQVADGQRRVLSPPGQAWSGLPETVEDFDRYDAVVLGSGLEQLLKVSAIEALREAVAAGNLSVLLARGRPYDPTTPEARAVAQAVAPLEPVIWGRGLHREARPLLTASGRAHPTLAFEELGVDPERVISALPAWVNLHAVESVKPGADVLMAAQAGQRVAPAIVAMPFGRGRVWAVLGEGLARWRLLPPDRAEARGAFESMWRGAVRWAASAGRLGSGEALSIEPARRAVRLDDPVAVELRLAKALPEGLAPTLRARGESGETITLPVGPHGSDRTVWRADWTPPHAGVWNLAASIENATPVSSSVWVYDLNPERRRASARPGWLKTLAESTGGRFFSAHESESMAGHLARLAVTGRDHRPAQYVWDRAWVLTVLVCWVGIEWIGRRQAGYW